MRTSFQKSEKASASGTGSSGAATGSPVGSDSIGTPSGQLKRKADFADADVPKKSKVLPSECSC